MTVINYSWAELKSAEPLFAEAGERLFIGADDVAIGFFTTTSKDIPRISPVCPVFHANDIYLVAGAATPKIKDLQTNPHYALHAFLGENDEEFRISGRADLVLDLSERSAVHKAIPFASFEKHDPIFRLGVTSILWVYWENVGQVTTRPVRRLWSAEQR